MVSSLGSLKFAWPHCDGSARLSQSDVALLRKPFEEMRMRMCSAFQVDRSYMSSVVRWFSLYSESDRVLAKPVPLQLHALHDQLQTAFITDHSNYGKLTSTPRCFTCCVLEGFLESRMVKAQRRCSQRVTDIGPCHSALPWPPLFLDQCLHWPKFACHKVIMAEWSQWERVSRRPY